MEKAFREHSRKAFFNLYLSILVQKLPESEAIVFNFILPLQGFHQSSTHGS